MLNYRSQFDFLFTIIYNVIHSNYKKKMNTFFFVKNNNNIKVLKLLF